MQLIINSSVFRCVTLQVSSNGDIERTQTQRPPQPVMPSALEDTAPSAAEETSRTGFGTGEEQHTMRLSSPTFLRTDRSNRDVDGVFTTEVPNVDGDEGSADTDMSGSCTSDSTNPSSRADVSSLDREIADCEDDAYDTDLESDEGESFEVFTVIYLLILFVHVSCTQVAHKISPVHSALGSFIIFLRHFFSPLVVG